MIEIYSVKKVEIYSRLLSTYARISYNPQLFKILNVFKYNHYLFLSLYII